MDNFLIFQSHFYKKFQYKIKDLLLHKKKYEKRKNQIQIVKNKMEHRKFGKDIQNLYNITEISNQSISEISEIREKYSQKNEYADKNSYIDKINLEKKMISLNKIIRNSKVNRLEKRCENKNLSIQNINDFNNYKNPRYSSNTNENKCVSSIQNKNDSKNSNSNSKFNQPKIYRNSVVLKNIRKNTFIKKEYSRCCLNYSNYIHINNKDRINKINIYNTINSTNNDIINNNNHLKYIKRIKNKENIYISNKNQFSKGKINNIKESTIMSFIRKQYNLPKEKENKKILNLSMDYRQKSKIEDIQKNKYHRKSLLNIPNRIDNSNELPIYKNSLKKLINKSNNISIVFVRNLNPQIPKEYINDIYKSLKLIEYDDLPLKNYMNIIQEDINQKMRYILIDWLVEVHIKFNLLPETLFITINLIDRFLSKKNIHRKYLQLLGITALFIACKYEEIYPPQIKQLIHMTDNAYNKKQVFKMENEILDVVHFNISFPTSLKFLEIFKNKLNLNDINFYRCLYFIEVSLIDYKSSCFNPSLIASTSLFFNLKSNNDKSQLEYNYKNLLNITGYSRGDIKICFECLNNAIKNLETKENKYNSIRRKFQLDKFLNVSQRIDYIKQKDDNIK